MVRGLKYCSSDICRSHRYKNRDDVGCTNIYRKTRREYPAIMDRSAPRWIQPAGKHELKWLGRPIRRIDAQLTYLEVRQNYAYILRLVLWRVRIMQRTNGNVINHDARRDARDEAVGMFGIIFPNVIGFLLPE